MPSAKKRTAKITRKTKETDITISLAVDGNGRTSVSTGIPFLDHMLTLMAAHGLFDLTVKIKGDLEIDIHHTNEDTGLALGQAFHEALGERKGIRRVGLCYVPMDEALARVALDISGRGMLFLRDMRPEPRKQPNSSAPYKWGDAEHFLESFARMAKVTLHIDVFAGSDLHHMLEAVFKALGRALDAATQIDPRVRGVPSTKGKL